MTDRQIAHFTVTKPLGSGAMGDVFLAFDPKLDRQVALKLLPERLCDDKTLRQRFLLEARSASAVNHPNICTIYEVGETASGRPFICMEFIDGETLEAKLQSDDVLSIETAIHLTEQILSALIVAHRHGIVHRDLKPGNIAINSQGLLKILDFGLAKRSMSSYSTAGTDHTTDLTLTGSIHGTPNYMSPEQASGDAVNHLSDIFSVGVILYQFLTGRLPFAGRSLPETLSKILHDAPPSPRSLNSAISESVEEVILKAISKKKDQRHQSAGDFLTALSETTERKDSFVTLVSSGSPAESDVYISYAGIDDQFFTGGGEGWISRFHRNLQVKLQQLTGRPIKIYQPPRFQDNDSPEQELLEEIPRARSFLSVVSPPFTNSPLCSQELEAFVNNRTSADSKLIKVVKTPVDETRLNAIGRGILSQVNNHDFYEQDPSGRILEFEESFGEDLKRRYYEKIYDVAHEINGTLAMGLDETHINLASVPIAYVAQTTSDVRGDYEIICRELKQRGFRILPDRPLPLERNALVEEVRNCLENATIVIQPIGASYGVVPENSDRSLLAIQSEEISSWMSGSKAQQFIWFEPNVFDDERQATFVNQLRTLDAARNNCELIEGNLSLLKEAISQHLTAVKQRESKGQSGGRSEDVRMVYLMCDSIDEDETETLENFLFQQGLEVSLPDFECGQDQVSNLHLMTLVECDAAIIFYGAAKKSWVDIKLRDTLKAAGYGRNGPIENVAVFIAPPFDKRKERFKSHQAEVILQPESGSLQDSKLLDFAHRIK